MRHQIIKISLNARNKNQLSIKDQRIIKKREQSKMMMIIAIIVILIILRIIAKKFLKKYDNPLYKFRGDYNYTWHGTNKQYYTETVRYSSTSKDNTIVFLFFAGNPGSIKFYDRFLYHLSEVYNKKYEIIGIGQAGQFKGKEKYEKYFNLDQQIDHKIQFFKDLTKQERYKRSKFVFIGHSFGCYTSLKLMSSINKDLIIHSIMLHPAFDRLLKTPNGIHRDSLHKFNGLFKILMRLIDLLLPIQVLRWACLKNFEKDRYKDGEDVNDCAEVLAQWIGYHTVQSFFYLTRFQFSEINDLDETLIKQLSNKMTVYYAKSDDWTPEYQKKEFKQKYENHVEYHEDEFGLDHAFVVGGSKVKARIIQKLLQDKFY